MLPTCCLQCINHFTNIIYNNTLDHFFSMTEWSLSISPSHCCTDSASPVFSARKCVRGGTCLKTTLWSVSRVSVNLGLYLPDRPLRLPLHRSNRCCLWYRHPAIEAPFSLLLSVLQRAAAAAAALYTESTKLNTTHPYYSFTQFHPFPTQLRKKSYGDVLSCACQHRSLPLPLLD